MNFQPDERAQLTARKLAAQGDDTALATINQALEELTQREIEQSAASARAAANGQRWARLETARNEVETAKSAPKGTTGNYALRLAVAQRNLREVESESKDLIEQEQRVATPSGDASWV